MWFGTWRVFDWGVSVPKIIMSIPTPIGGRSAASSVPRWARRLNARRASLWSATGAPRGGGGTYRKWGYGGISPHQRIKTGCNSKPQSISGNFFPITPSPPPGIFQSRSDWSDEPLTPGKTKNSRLYTRIVG